VKTYDNASAIPAIAPMLGPGSSVVTLQNGVERRGQLANRVGEEPVVGGTAYIATALAVGDCQARSE
jgi:2-dehydropantoate 2-reductase